MTVTFGRIFSKPLHPLSWKRPAGNTDYRVTNTFDGPDLLNGGKHRAVDAGNFGVGEPLYAPITGRARALRHFDGALGAEFDLGFGWTLELWHLNRTDLPAIWAPVKVGQPVGTTGRSGAPLKDGSPMPAHTHIALKHNGVPVDPEPHLFGASLTLVEDDMPLPAIRIPFAKGTAAINVRVRKEPSTTAEFYQLKATTVFDVLIPSVEGDRYTLDGGKTYRTDWAMVARNEVGFVARPLLDITPTAEGTALGGVADCSKQDAKLAQAGKALTAVRAAADAALKVVTG